MMLWMGSVLPCDDGRLGQLLTAVQSYCGCDISAVSVTTSLGSEQPLRRGEKLAAKPGTRCCAERYTHVAAHYGERKTQHSRGLGIQHRQRTFLGRELTRKKDGRDPASVPAREPPCATVTTPYRPIV